MLKFLMIFISLTLLLQASDKTKICHFTIDTMIATYFEAQNLESKQKYKQSLLKFRESHGYAYEALLVCQDNPEFDFNIMYNYIIASENKIYKILEIQ